MIEEKFSGATQLERTLGLCERVLAKAHGGPARLVESVGGGGA